MIKLQTSLKSLAAMAWAIFALALATNVVQAQENSPAAAVATSTSSAPTASSQKVDTEWDGVTAEVTGVKRTEGDSILVQFKYTNSGAKKAIFSESNFHHENLAALVYYIDPKNKKKYTVIQDTDQKPVASDSRSLILEPGASKSGWCKLPAPPADVVSVTLVIPGAPPFEKTALAAQ